MGELMAQCELGALLRLSEGNTFLFAFSDGTEMEAKLISASHVDEDETIVILRVGAVPDECAWQVHLPEIISISSPTVER
jgi:hypothetical protein